MAASKKSAAPKKNATRTTPARASQSARAGLAAPTRPTTPADTFTSKPLDISFAGEGHRFARVDLEIEGIDHGEASYEGRVFLDNDKATAATPEALTDGFAGSFYIFGHGGCVGDVGHCEVKGTRRDPTDLRYPHPLTPASKTVEITEAVRELAKTKTAVTVTIVPVVSAANALCDTKNVFKFQSLRVVSYNA